MWHLQLLGTIALRSSDAHEHVITKFRTRRAASLLGYLALHRGEQKREFLATLLWPDVSPLDARNNLRVSLSALRAQLEPVGVVTGSVLHADRHCISLHPGSVSVDVDAFQEQWRAAENLSRPERIEVLNNAFDLYTGRLLTGSEEEWSEPLALRLEELFAGITEELVAWYQECGDSGQALEIAGQATMRSSGIGESSTRATIRRRGRNSPTVQTHNHLPNPHTPLKGANATETDFLPLYPTRFWGRESELQSLQHILSDTMSCRLCTLVGPPAIGKTRLAIEAAREAMQQNWHVRFISLATLSHAEGFADAVRAGLGLPSTPHLQPLAQVVAFLRELGRSASGTTPSGTPSSDTPAKVLLLLDNLEHLLPEAALEVQTLRLQVPEVTIWVTSRALLGVPGEEPLLVEGLPLPDENDDVSALEAVPSVQLFVSRSRGVRPTFALSETNAQAIARLCRRLEGWPLPLELAAARAHSFTPAQMLEQLETKTDFLESHLSNHNPILARQGSLDAAIAWSFDLLSEPARALLGVLSAFRGGAALEELSDVARALGIEVERFALPLTELVSQSLAWCEEKGGVLRYYLLEGVRQYVQCRLSDEEQEAHARQHALAFGELVGQAKMTGEDSPACLAHLDFEQPNFRAALEWARKHDGPFLLRLCGALWPYWEVRGQVPEGREWLQVALAHPGLSSASSDRIIEAHNGFARLSFAAGDFPAGKESAQKALLLSCEHGNLHGEAQALLLSGIIALYSGQVAFAFEQLERSRALFEVLGEPSGEAHALTYLGFTSIFGGGFEESFQTYVRAAEKAREAGDFARLTIALFFCGDALGTVGGRYDEAVPFWEEGLQIAARLGECEAIPFLNWGLCHAAISRCDLETAHAFYKVVDEDSQRHGNRWGQVFILETGAFLAGARDDWERAALLLGAAERAREERSMPLTASYYAQYEAHFAPLWKEMTPEKREALWRRGRAHSLDEALQVARGIPVVPEGEALPFSEGPPKGFPLDQSRAVPFLAEAHFGTGRLALWQNDHRKALVHFQKARELYGALHDETTLASVQRWMTKVQGTSSFMAWE